MHIYIYTHLINAKKLTRQNQLLKKINSHYVKVCGMSKFIRQKINLTRARDPLEDQKCIIEDIQLTTIFKNNEWHGFAIKILYPFKKLWTLTFSAYNVQKLIKARSYFPRKMYKIILETSKNSRFSQKSPTNLRI